MAAVTITAGSPFLESMGSSFLTVWNLTAVSDTNTLATGLTGVKAYWVNWIGNPATQASAGGHSTISAGTITFYPSTDSLAATVFVMT